MTRRVGLILVLALLTASTGLDAQIGGLLRKKAGEVLGKKAEPAQPAPSAPAPTPGDPATATAPVKSPAAPAVAAATKDPLDVSALPVRQSADQVLRGNVNRRSNGDWDQLPYIPTAATSAAYALGDAARASLVETVGAALRTLVASPAFLAEHDAYIKREYQAVDHGLTGVVSLEDALKRNDLKSLEAIQLKEMVAMGVDQARTLPADFLKMTFNDELAGWRKHAANPKLRDRAKYQKLVDTAQPLEALPTDDVKFRNGYAVLKSIDAGGPDTEAAVMAISARVHAEKEQAAWDSHNLKGQLRQQLSTFVAIASKVNFDAATVQKDGKTMFVNAADEKQGALWKACFRAGEAPTAAAVKLAKAWLSEL